MTVVRGEFIENVTSTGTAAEGASSAAIIPYHPGITYVNITFGGTDSGVAFSSSYSPGDIVETYFDGSSGAIWVYVPDGESIQGFPSGFASSAKHRFVKLSATLWGVIP
jgi:hypothetical protein